jgi:hypothetical protein
MLSWDRENHADSKTDQEYKDDRDQCPRKKNRIKVGFKVCCCHFPKDHGRNGKVVDHSIEGADEIRWEQPLELEATAQQNDRENRDNGIDDVNHFSYIPLFRLSVNTHLLSHMPDPNKIFSAEARRIERQVDFS